MRYLKTITYLMFSTCMLFSCNNNGSTNGSTSAGNSSGASGSGNDYYYESTLTMTGKDLNMNELMKMYVSAKGDMRTEADIKSSLNGNKATAPMILIGKADKPTESISIDDSAKSYTINQIDTGKIGNSDMKINSTATKIGNETIMGFNCVHARVISNKSMGKFYNSSDTVDIWKSNDVPIEPSVKNKLDEKGGTGLYSAETAQQLKDMGCSGMTVKMTSNSDKNQMTVQLTKVERKDLPASLFEVPSGYKEIKE